MADDVLLDKRADGVALITLNRPDSLNAMGGKLMPMLADYLKQCQWDKEVRAVVLTGAGRAFCAGGDVKGMGRRDAPNAEGGAPAAGNGEQPSIIGAMDDAVAALRESQFSTSYVLHTMPKPTIAMVNGYAVGAGLSLALACDLRIASDQAKFGTAFRNVGLSGDYGGSYFMTRLVGIGKARELYFTADMLDAQEAHRVGIANRVVAHDKLAEETLALAAKLASGPTGTFARMKANLNMSQQLDLKSLLDYEALHMRLSGMSNDSREAVRAFIEKRDAKFSGR
ncbi:MAG: enoyl-CoA hydratase [Dehalococcoidia bacterium]